MLPSTNMSPRFAKSIPVALRLSAGSTGSADRCSTRREAGSTSSVQHKWIAIGAVGPDDSASFLVHPHLREEVRVGQRLEDRAMQFSCEIDIAPAAIAEAEFEPVVAEHLYRCHGYELAFVA
jgi:hypothetical protein